MAAVTDYKELNNIIDWNKIEEIQQQAIQFGGIFITVDIIVRRIEQLLGYKAVKTTLDKKIHALSYMTMLKHLSPILLGIGLGIRLARTHFDVDVELRKAAELRRAASVSEAPLG